MEKLTRADLHRLIDELPEDEVGAAGRALAALGAPAPAAEPAVADGDAGGAGERAGRAATLVPGRTFFSDLPPTPAQLAQRQGVQPIVDPETLRGDFWPEDETADEFIETVRQWRREGGYA